MAVGKNQSNSVKPFNCNTCQKDFMSAEKLNSHMQQAHGRGKGLRLDIAAAQQTSPLNTLNTGNDQRISTPTRILDSQEPADFIKDLPSATMNELIQNTLTPSLFGEPFRRSLNQYDGLSAPASQVKDLSEKEGYESGGLETIGDNGLLFPSHQATQHGLQVIATQLSGGFQVTTGDILKITAQNPFSFVSKSNVFIPNPVANVCTSVHGQDLARLREFWMDSQSRDTATPASEFSVDIGSSRGKKRSVEDDSDNISIASTTSKRSRILPTNDPQVADKRLRNRIAAEKCRNKRKARQVDTEQTNKMLQNQLTELEAKHNDLKQLSQVVIEDLQQDNAKLKAENESLRGMVGKSHSIPFVLQSNM